VLSKLQVDEATRTLRLTGSASLPMVSPHVYTPNYIRCGVSDGPSSYYGATALSGQSTIIKVGHADLTVEAFTNLRDTGTCSPHPKSIFSSPRCSWVHSVRRRALGSLGRLWAAIGIA
jgi:hypothetical protein